MGEPRHILLFGERGVGKSTLIERLLAVNTRPVAGFVTKRLPPDETGFHPIYIHEAGIPVSARVYTEENQIGVCDSKVHKPVEAVFDTLGVQYLGEAQPGGRIVMDELGFLEARADAFRKAVFRALEGGIPVLAAVKARYDVPFLNEVRAHKNCTVYEVTPENRDALYETLLPVILAWNDME